MVIMTPEKELELSLAITPFSTDTEWLLDYIMKNDVLPADHAIVKFANSFAAAKKANDSAAFRSILNAAKVEGKWSASTTVDFGKAYKKVMHAYPLLNIINNYRSSGNKAECEAAVEYIELMDIKASIVEKNLKTMKGKVA